jgi:DNA polymerase III subunit beta
LKITCEREPLSSAFQLAASVAPARSPKEILQNVKITAEGQTVTFTATDLEVGIRLALEEGVEVQSPGSALLPVMRIGAMLRESTDPTITIETDDSGVKVTGTRSKYRLPGANPDEFPRVVGFEESAYHEIPARLFREMVKRTVFATDVESSRYALGGVLLEMEGTSVRAVGTDGRRLCRMEGTADVFGEHKTNGATTIVPSRAIQLMARAAGDDETVKVASRLNDILLQTSKASIYSRLVEGRYPNWRQVFPKREDASQIDMTVGPLFAALRQAAIVTDSESRGINFTFADGTLKLEAHTAEIGESHVEIPIPYDGKPVTLTMDNRFVSDFCKVLDADASFVFEIETANTPAVLSTDDGYAYVIMPMARE